VDGCRRKAGRQPRDQTKGEGSLNAQETHRSDGHRYGKTNPNPGKERSNWKACHVPSLWNR
jgi:hypothetical protein